MDCVHMHLTQVSLTRSSVILLMVLSCMHNLWTVCARSDASLGYEP